MRIVTWLFGALYGLALALLGIAASGVMGAARDPLGGVFLLPLGLPWNLLGDRLGLPGLLSLCLAPAINLAILAWLARRRERRP